MKRTIKQCAVVGVVLMTLATQALGADVGRVLRSTAFPGMGQLADEQVGRGLLYMAGEVVLLSLAIDQAVSKSAYDRATVYDSVKMDLAQTFDEKKRYYDDWQDMIEKSDQAQMLTFVFGGAAAVWWAWNIVDALLFGPDKAEETGLIKSLKDNTVVSVNKDKASLTYRLTF